MWVTEFRTTTPDGTRSVLYETRMQSGYSRAERRDRVRVSGRVVHSGWVSDHKGYEIFKAYQNGEEPQP